MIRKLWNRDKWMLTPQSEHARVAGLLAAMWNFPGEKATEEVFLAIRRHDDGWKAFEENMRVSPVGAPMNFTELDPTHATEIWSRSSEMLAKDSHNYAAALVASHFLFFAEHAADLSRLSVRASVALGKFIGQQRYLVEQCHKNARPGDEAAAGQYDQQFQNDLRFLKVCDALSIYLCSDQNGQIELLDVPYLSEGDRLTVSRKGDNLALTVSPLPFKKNLRDHVSAYIVPRKEYDSDEELQNTLKSSKLVTNEIHMGSPAS